MERHFIDQIAILSPVLMILLIGIVSGTLVSWTITLFLKALQKRNEPSILSDFQKHCSGAFMFFLPVLFIYIGLQSGIGLNGEEVNSMWVSLFKVLLILSSSFLLIRGTRMMEAIVLRQYDLTKVDNRQERKIVTQMVFIKKAIIVTIVLITGGVLLLSFEEGRKYGASLLASAGVASIIIGFAAQKSIANFLAGIQIAFTQPMKIDDAVLVENEWGWIEEINLTYVVVRLWDWRRLVLPITYFIEKPFQNWTRNKGDLIGSVFLYLDYRTPIGLLRTRLEEIIKDEPNWDGKVVNLQVADAKDHVIVVRALMTAKTSPQAWDLRCSVREKLITFLQEHYPESLPKHRVILEK